MARRMALVLLVGGGVVAALAGCDDKMKPASVQGADILDKTPKPVGTAASTAAPSATAHAGKPPK